MAAVCDAATGEAFFALYLDETCMDLSESYLSTCTDDTLCSTSYECASHGKLGLVEVVCKKIHSAITRVPMRCFIDRVCRDRQLFRMADFQRDLLSLLTFKSLHEGPRGSEDLGVFYQEEHEIKNTLKTFHGDFQDSTEGWVAYDRLVARALGIFGIFTSA